MIAILLSPFYILINFYIARWLLSWMQACSKHFKKRWIRVLVITIYTFFASALIIGFLLPTSLLERIMKLIGNYWLGVLLYIILTVLIADGIRLVAIKSKKVPNDYLHSKKVFVIVGTICITIISTLSIWGVINARIIHTTNYEVTINKKVEKIKKLRIALVADLHLGYNIGTPQMRKMVTKINNENPDIVVIAGDIFDNEYEALDNPKKLINTLKQIKSKYGVYATYGNHDIKEKILAGFTFNKKGEKKESDIRMDQFLEKANITLLRDEYVLIDNSFYLYGRPDYKKPGRGIEIRKTPKEIVSELNKKKPIIVVDHEPNELEELATSGVDMDLCGHTHDGQMFPGNITTSLMWENSYGYLKKGNMHNIVTSGVGLFGPNMRVGTKAEVAIIDTNFK